MPRPSWSAMPTSVAAPRDRTGKPTARRCLAAGSRRRAGGARGADRRRAYGDAAGADAYVRLLVRLAVRARLPRLVARFPARRCGGGRGPRPRGLSPCSPGPCQRPCRSAGVWSWLPPPGVRGTRGRARGAWPGRRLPSLRGPTGLWRHNSARTPRSSGRRRSAAAACVDRVARPTPGAGRTWVERVAQPGLPADPLPPF